MSELVLYTNPMSRGRIARWMLEEIGQPYETRIIGYGPAMREPGFLDINPMGKIPVLQHGDAVVTETAAIIAYLAETFPEADLLPKTERERAAYYRWLFFASGPLEAAVTNRSLGVSIPDDKRGMVGYGSFETVVKTLAKAVSAAPFITGDRFTAADVYVGSHVAWGLQFGTLDQHPDLSAYVDRATARNALRRAAQADDALLAEGADAPAA